MRLNRLTGPLIDTAIRVPDGRLFFVLARQLRQILCREVMRNALARKARLGLNGLAMWLHDYIAMHLRSAPEKRECLRTLQRSTLQWPPFYT
ncbi:hypothetical protein [Pseudoxanthomonas sp.]|uniref:hypothetical protein n=1 Tax=Pseudoxanthomonas sp. TaxID=1871049 RepID=UPI002FE2C198